MISLAAVEMLAAELWPDALSAVAAVPDLRKGERLILFTQRGRHALYLPEFRKGQGCL
jgi:acyl-[acyl-carrier-protein]-phospholipid O-acyltransferase/long-chain-fatty-acid--[acyl-carrier-protein] ligase